MIRNENLQYAHEEERTGTDLLLVRIVLGIEVFVQPAPVYPLERPRIPSDAFLEVCFKFDLPKTSKSLG